MNASEVLGQFQGDRFPTSGHDIRFDALVKHPALARRAPSLAATLAVLGLARKIEPNILAVADWYRKVPIVELGNVPARELVAMGEGESVVAFLKSILRGLRD